MILRKEFLMNKRKLTAIVLALISLVSTCPTTMASSTDKEIIAQETFSLGMSGWSNTDSNDFFVLNERLNLKSKNKNISSVVTDGISVENGELEFDMNVSETGYLSTLFRYVDKGTYYELRFYPKSGRVLLFKKVNGGLLTEIKSGYYPIKVDTDMQVHITLLTDKFIVYINDTEVLKAEDKSISAGKLGFGGSDSKGYIDNIILYKTKGVNYDAVDPENVVEPIRIYVSQDGNNDGDGTEQNPYKTIQKAKNAISRYKNNINPIEVIIKEGIYRLDSVLSFTKADSGTKQAPITYKAAEGEEVIISGAKEIDISKFEPIAKETQERLRANVRNKVLQLDLAKQGFARDTYNWAAPGRYNTGSRIKVLNITLNHNLQSIARWPNSGYKVITDCDSTTPPKIFYEESNPSRWTQAKNFFIDGYLMHDWSPEWALVNKVDPLTNSINLNSGTSYGIRVGGKWAAVNLLEELDIAGEWYIDFDTMMMYYYPPHKLDENDMLEMSHVNGVLVSMSGVSHVNFDGIHFTMNQGGGGTGIHISGESNNLNFENCIVDNVARHGIQIADGNNITIDNCIINNTGESGIDIQKCGNMETLESGNVVVKNCDIANPSLYAGGNGTGCVTTEENTVGVQIINNVLHSVANSAIRYKGLGHRFAYNEIYNAVNEASDAGAIYSGRSWTYYGNIAEYNFFHDIGQIVNTTEYTASSMFWDDYNNGGEFSHNISYINNKNKTMGVLLGGGSDNIIKGNTVVAAERVVAANDRGEQNWEKYGRTTLRYDYLPVTTAPYVKKYPKVATIFERIEANGGIWKRENTIIDNLGVDIVNEQGSTYTQPVVQGGTIERNVYINEAYDEIFVNPDDMDFRVKKSAKEKYNISDEILDEDFDIDSIGRQGKPEIPMDRMEFEAIYPENGDDTVDISRTVLAWTAAPIADYYDVILSDDPEFKTTILDTRTIKTSMEVTDLEPGKTYYWKVKAINASRQYGCETEAKGGVKSFTVAKESELDISGLKLSVTNAENAIKTLKEGPNPGDYRTGSISAVQAKINKGKSLLNKKVGQQTLIDQAAYEINRTLTNLEGFVNPGYTTLNLTEKSPWVTNNASGTTFTAEDGHVKVDLTQSAEITLDETLSNYNVMCFKTKVDNFNDNAWFAYGLRALNTKNAIYEQDAYYILIKEDVFELQKKGIIYKTAPNNGKFKAGEWHELKFGSITTENGINMFFEIDGEVIFDYLDKTNPQRRPGSFAMYFRVYQPNCVEIMDAETVPTGVYQFSDAILKEMKQDASAGDVLGTNADTYTERGSWTDKAGALGDQESQVRTSSGANASAKWEMNAGSNGNSKLYNVSYYHIPSENGDKKVDVLVSGYGGEYKTTIDLSQGEEGYVDLGTFMFIAADYVGRLTVTFTGSGEGELNVSNVKFEHTENGKNMLK